MNRLVGFVFLCAALFSGCKSDEASYNKELNDFYQAAPEVFSVGNPDSIDACVETLYQAIQKPSHIDNFNFYSRKSWYFRRLGDWKLGLIYTDSMLAELTPILGVEKQYIKTLNIRGGILRGQKMYDEALKQLYAAKIFTENTSDPCEATDIYLNLGTILYEKENYEESLLQYRWIINTLAICSENNIKPYLYNLNAAFNAAGLCHEKLGNYDSSLFYYQKSLALLREKGPEFPEQSDYVSSAEGVTRGNLGLTYMFLGVFDTAEKVFKASIAQNSSKPRLKEDVLFTKIKLIRLYARSKNFAAAKNLIREIEEANFQTPTSFMRLEEVKHELYKEEGDLSKAYEAFINYNRARDSIRTQHKEILPINLTETYTYLSQKEQIHTLEDAEQEQKYMLFVAFISVIALLIIAYLIRRNLLESKDHLKTLNAVNSELFVQHDQLENTLKALEKSHNENKRLMKVLAHDLRSPIGGMISLAELIKDSPKLEGEEAESLAMIEKIGRDSLLMMEDILDLKEALPIQKKTELDLFELVTYCTALMQLRANEKQQKIHLSGASTFLPLMRDQVWRAVNNILNNAIKFSPKGSSIYVSISQTEHAVQLSIRDEGIGIPNEFHDKLFSVVAGAQRSGTEGEKTFGLGLPLAKRVMDLHDGKIWFESKLGKGSTFYLEFPII